MSGRTITDIQLARIDELNNKLSLTDKQAIELTELIKKRDSNELPIGVQNYLKKLYRGIKWNREGIDITSKYISKGNSEEQASITLLSLETKKFFKKNEQRLSNEYITGLPDIFIGESIESAEKGWDVKTSWDWTTLPYKGDKLDKDYEWQAHCYLFLTGAKEWTISHCLVNIPAELLDDEKRKLQYKIKSLDPESDPDYVEKAKKLEINFIYDYDKFVADYPYYQLLHTKQEWVYDVDRSQRVVSFLVKRDEKKIEEIKKRVEQCRLYIKQNLMK
jgi:hypothetical protein